MNNYEFGNFLCRQRQQKNLSQAELAAILGVTNKAVSKWENGAAYPSTELMLPLAQALGVTIEELYKTVTKSKKPPSALRRGMDAVAGHPGITYPLLATPGILSYLLFVLFGVNPEKNVLLVLTPIVCLIAFGGGLLVFGIQIKNPLNNSAFMDWVTALIFLFLCLAWPVLFTDHLVNLKERYTVATPLLSAMLCMLVTLHRIRMHRHH